MTASNQVAAAIPDAGAFSSSITVGGAGPFLWDVDLRTLIRHTFPADLDITLRSPMGTVVTICTDAGAGADDVFDGTWWDDGAGMPPPKPAGPVSDYSFTNHVVAEALVPEGAMSAFLGENPNGVWTLTVADDHAGDTGSLNGWTLQIATLAAAPATSDAAYFEAPMLGVPDAGTLSRTVEVPAQADGSTATVVGVELETSISHTACGDLDMYLVSPTGTVVTISTDNGGTLDHLFRETVWKDDAPGGPVTDAVFVNGVAKGTLVPEEAMGAFRGENAGGTWTLRVDDDRWGDTGTLQSWSLTLRTASNAAAPPPPSHCPCDFNNADGVTIQDVYDFLTAWSAASPAADFNGQSGVTVQDIYDFLTCVINTAADGAPCP